MTDMILPVGYEVVDGRLTIDGTPFPYGIELQGPRVEAVDGNEDFMHILWLPVIIEAPLPAYVTEAPGVPLEIGGTV